MSEIKVNSIKGVAASSAALTINNTDGTCTANITNNLSNRNLIINGAMQVAQRGTSSTNTSYQTVDRFEYRWGGADEDCTQSQSDVASGTTPYTLGFRKAYKVQNGNQTSGAGATDNVYLRQRIEAQDIANSGWNYTSSSSYVTLSFWVKSSVAQNFYGYLRTAETTEQSYPFETGSLSANTWTKITKTIPGNSNIVIANDTGIGTHLHIVPFFGTDYTGSVSLNAWGAYASATRVPDMTSTWWTTNDATFEITGVQLEVGSVATDFEHRSFGQELALCQRYFYQYADASLYGSGIAPLCVVMGYQDNNAFGTTEFPVTMRATPTLVHVEGTSFFKILRNAGNGDLNALTLHNASRNSAAINAYTAPSGNTIGQDQVGIMQTNNTSCRVGFSAEL